MMFSYESPNARPPAKATAAWWLPLAVVWISVLVGCSNAEESAQQRPPSSQTIPETGPADHMSADHMAATESGGSGQAGSGQAVKIQERPPVFQLDNPPVIRDATATEMSPPPMITGSSRFESLSARSAAPKSAAPKSTAPKSTAPKSPGSQPVLQHAIEQPRVEALAMQAPPSSASAPAPMPSAPDGFDEPMSSLPAGSTRNDEGGYATIEVFYATDRSRSTLPLSAYEVTGQKRLFMSICLVALMTFGFALFNWFRGRSKLAMGSALIGIAAGCFATAVVTMGQTNIEKHGVTYNADRGVLTRGICEVTVPNSHQRGQVERPSLLRFEFREDQSEHMVLTSAVELGQADFGKRMAERVGQSPRRDLLLFIHGYNVDFQSAVQRTAQMAVDLPFEGVPVCYSWPSQGTLIGYPIDENNSEWTTTHLREFLLELANESGAESINVVAHSMGNRAMVAAMQQISWQLPEQSPPPFDRIVMAAPDVDADRFRRDLAGPLTKVANHVTLYASSDDQALIASKQVHGYPRAGESGDNIVVVAGVETVDVSGIDLSLLGHSYYGDNESMLRELYDVVRGRLPARQRPALITRRDGELVYWQLASQSDVNGSDVPLR
ncbi:hypothetical protein K227x_26730 [Rubripirellula lacrimiformis]|uniref:Alpha/beta hydrolase family protein n=1 Tax=Rubripirellula lacrimiformis TaxID=1930273 RepID=A0A517NAX7_9BACT|nr:alpha/beta hydrolase [Rubripirellula lacrimiformis]QDT04283.1 hypothetical protein K227x_26730 [Rubripirellula lacrimiformis]